MVFSSIDMLKNDFDVLLCFLFHYFVTYVQYYFEHNVIMHYSNSSSFFNKFLHRTSMRGCTFYENQKLLLLSIFFFVINNKKSTHMSHKQCHIYPSIARNVNLLNNEHNTLQTPLLLENLSIVI